FRGQSPVAGIIYIDSKAQGFFIGDDELQALVSMSRQFLGGLQKTPVITFDRIHNVPLTGLGKEVPVADKLPNDVKHVLELVTAFDPPKRPAPFQFNFNSSDLFPAPG